MTPNVIPEDAGALVGAGRLTPFFSRTGTKRNLKVARDAGWGILVSAAGVWRDEGFALVGADNGQWSERDNPGPFKEGRFLRFLDWLGDRALWLVLPDIVCGGLASLALSLKWLDRLRGHPSILLIAVQDGMTPEMIRPFLGPRVGIFIGGSTEWKVESAPKWGELAAETGCYLHMGRVNSVKRVGICATIGAKSCDGTSVTRYACTLAPLDAAARQPDMGPSWIRPANHSPEGFARRCREIVANMPGHPAHAALDILTNDLLRELGFGAGISVFEVAVRGWHVNGLPYPLVEAA